MGSHAFVFCSGFFSKDKFFGDSIIKDVKGLLIPGVTFCCVLVLVQFMSNGSAPQARFLDENCYILYYTIWFLIYLFICRLFYRLIVKLHNILVVSMLWF